MPDPSRQTWENSAKGFEEQWRFPNCIGCIDGKHVTIKCPARSGSQYFSYLKKFSMVLLAIVGPDYSFLCIDVGSYGKNSDAGILEESGIGIKFERNLFDIPAPKCLPRQSEPTPFVLLGDEGFPLKPYLMRPFPNRQARSDTQKEKFNNCLCATRRIVENAFGILAQKWRIFLRPLELKPENCKKVIRTACVLHNFLRSKQQENLFLEMLEPQEAPRAFNTIYSNNRRSTNHAFQIREKFLNYFVSNNNN